MKNQQVSQQQFTSPVVREYNCQVLVAGAGPAGLMAAIAAAREGADVLLVERHGFVGGMLTAGEVRNIRVFNDGAGQWVIGGAPREYLKELEAHGGSFYDPQTYECVQQNPELTRYLGEKLCQKYGVRLLYHSWLCGAIVENDTVRGAYLMCKEGICAVHCDVGIDATGDGDFAAFAGAAFEKSPDMQPMTTTFLLGGVDSDLGPIVLSKESHDKFKALQRQGLYPVPRDDIPAFKTARRGEVYCNITRYPGDCTSSEDLTKAEIACREQIMNCIDFLRREIPEFKNCYLIKSAPQVGVRESRRIQGMYTLTEEDIVSNRKFDDMVALNSYFIDIHHQNEKTTHYKHEPGTYNGIPYRCMLPVKVEGILTCGRCISATHVGHAAIRVMGTAMGMGEAAGTAAAMAVKAGVSPRNVNIRALQERLRENGVPLPPVSKA